MRKKKILMVVGARPQFIKAAVVSRAMKEHDKLQEIIVHTGQHFDINMSEVFFEELNIPKPDYNLGIGGLTHGAMTGRQLEEIEKILLKEKPDWVLVYGDTNSTLAGALAAVKLHIPVAHVEAGLRSFNRRMPEEINRVLTDHASDLLFAPTQNAVDNLKKEGVTDGKIEMVGDVMYDAALFYATKAEIQSHILQTLGLCTKKYILTTLHRQENIEDPDRLIAIIQGLSTSSLPVVWPLHPRTRKRLAKLDFTLIPPIHPIEPVGYLDMVMLEKNANLIATDSGGVQKEAYFYSVPCLTLREETEWIELVRVGANHLIGANSAKLTQFINHISRNRMDVTHENLYGEGDAGLRISARLVA